MGDDESKDLVSAKDAKDTLEKFGTVYEKLKDRGADPRVLGAIGDFIASFAAGGVPIPAGTLFMYALEHHVLPRKIDKWTEIADGLDPLEPVAETIADSIDALVRSHGATTAEIRNLLEQIARIGNEVTDPHKREILRIAAIHAFDADFYEQGLASRFLSVIEQVEYGEIALMREVLDRATWNRKHQFYHFKAKMDEEGGWYDHGPEHYHAQRLDDLGLVKYNKSHGSNEILIQWFGQKFLEFISESTGQASKSAEDPDTEGT